VVLRPWREVVTPHPDVATGRYHQAEFAADLAQVISGRAEPEYHDPVEFFARTYLTEGISRLLQASLERLSGKGGEPVIQLKTAFGGGKTHTMLALYHLVCTEAAPEQLSGIPAILEAVGIKALPQAKCAVIAGTALNPSREREDAAGNGVIVRTLWGEIAAQLGGQEAYALVESADKTGTAPGSDDLVALFEHVGPCVVLLDELVAYARNIYGKQGLTAGSFDSNMTFVQSLTEAARRSPNALLVAAIPESNIEIGGEAGEAALARIENTFGRMEAVWKPVGATEGFEIVRRRLFTPVKDEKARDAVCSAFSSLYTEGAADFPAECKEGAYLQRLRSAYPIHPEVFDRLYGDWASLERFQRTRGVLRLMASAIHELWTRGDQSLLIMPSSMPLDAPRVRDELTRYLTDGWTAVVDTDIDGEQSEPRKIDEANPRLGALSAARRVARTIFLGSAPSVRQQNVRGVEDIRIRLGVTQPKESVAVYNDALGRLSDRLTHLYGEGGRYWYDLQPNLKRTMEDRASRLRPDAVEVEIERRLRAERERGSFRGVHVCPTSADVPDEQTVRLVVLGPTTPHRRGNEDSPAFAAAREILEQRGNSPRQNRNMLVFFAPDGDGLTAVAQEVRRYLAWKSIGEDHETLNLDAHQHRQAVDAKRRSDETVEVRLQEAYCWLLVPTQDGTGPLEWETTRIAAGSDGYVARASKKVTSAEQLITRWSPALLKMELDRWLWKDTPHISTQKLWEYLTTYCYLPRLRDMDVLTEAIKEGLRSRDYFAYAGDVGEDGRYLGLQLGTAGTSVHIDSASVLVKPDVAAKQLAAEATVEESAQPPVGVTPDDRTSVLPLGTGGRIESSLRGKPTQKEYNPPEGGPTVPKRFFGKVVLDSTRVARDAGRIAEEVIQHLAGLVDAEVRVTLEIEAEIPSGAPDAVVRTVTENCRVLKFEAQEFEDE
jgi:predicted AAA+ superfamily ATPase